MLSGSSFHILLPFIDIDWSTFFSFDLGTYKFLCDELHAVKGQKVASAQELSTRNFKAGKRKPKFKNIYLFSEGNLYFVSLLYAFRKF